MSLTEPFDVTNKVAVLNDVYFGSDKSKNYIKHDFRRALEGFIQREVVLHVMIESSKKRHDTQENTDDNGHVVSVAHGDFDPDNAGFLYSIFKNHELGSMLDLRLLLTNQESGAGGSFVNDLMELELDDFIDYYLNKKPDSIVIPSFLSWQFMKSRHDEKMKGDEFIRFHMEDIAKAVEQLKSKARKFNDSNYKNRIVTNYEALKFHKDRQPNKYEINEVAETMGPLSYMKTTRKDLSKVETKLISKALNEFAELVEMYRLLAGGIDGLYGSSWPLETYVKRTFEIFNKDVPMEVKDKVIADLEKHLSVSFKHTMWSTR